MQNELTAVLLFAYLPTKTGKMRGNKRRLLFPWNSIDSERQ